MQYVLTVLFLFETQTILQLNIKLLLLLFCLSILSCNTKPDSQKTTWIGGEIINPGMDYVILSKGNQLLDTVKLDSNNSFLYEAKNVESGLYTFKNKEYQSFYLEPGDSLMIRVNIWDFDESLSYTGIGSEKNNLLMDLYLQDERENMGLQQIYSLTPDAFEKKADSMRSLRMANYDKFVEDYEPTEGFKETAIAGIDYDYYSKKEQYTKVNKYRSNQDETFKYPKGFYDYRKNLDFNNYKLRFYYPYYSFMKNYVDNLAYKTISDRSMAANCSYPLNHKKLFIIDSLVKNDSLRNDLLRTKARLFFMNAKSSEDQKKILDEFMKLNNNPRHKSEISQLAEVAMQLNPGNTIPNLSLLTSENTETSLHQIIKKPTVFFFWSNVSVKHYQTIHAKAAEMQSKYPEYEFIGINTDSHFKNWLHIVKNSKYNLQSEFEFENPKDAEKKLILNSSNKAIVVDKDLKILDGNTNMNNANFEEQLLGFLNRSNQ